MSKKIKQPTQTEIKKALRESAFNPREPGVFKVIMDVDSNHYFINRAIELCHTGLQMLESKSNPSAVLQTAISLLALARVKLTVNPKMQEMKKRHHGKGIPKPSTVNVETPKNDESAEDKGKAGS